mmetsp:Transcript_123035/g.309650  ORF Transcript_123035/g.309650 Transcript_123035/m.309650 type:complete len:254 (+) Transcript_123035:1811-2572(+)
MNTTTIERLVGVGLAGTSHGAELHRLGHLTQTPLKPISSKTARSLQVTIVGAMGLVKQDSLDNADPYCVVVLSDAGSQEKSRYQTSMQHNTQNPEWNHEFVVGPYIEGDSLEFVVMDRDFWKSTVLGTAALTDDQIFPQGFEGELPVISAHGGHEMGQGATLKLKVELMRGPDDDSLSGFIQESGVATSARNRTPLAGLTWLKDFGSGICAMLVAVLSLAVVAARAFASGARARSWHLFAARSGSWEPLVVVE